MSCFSLITKVYNYSCWLAWIWQNSVANSALLNVPEDDLLDLWLERPIQVLRMRTHFSPSKISSVSYSGEEDSAVDEPAKEKCQWQQRVSQDWKYVTTLHPQTKCGCVKGLHHIRFKGVVKLNLNNVWSKRNRDYFQKNRKKDP